MRRTVRVALATVIMGSALTLTACDNTDDKPVAPAGSTEPKTEKQAQEEAQDLVDGTVGNM